MARVDPARLRLERRVATFVATHEILRHGETAVLLLSGGADSMALLALAQAVDRRLGLRLRLVAAHVDYRARGEESDRDREIVERACAAAGVPLHVHRLGRPLTGGGFQARARELRYRFAREVAACEGAAAIVTGHNRDDQAETVLYRLAKYASPGGLVGMRPRDGALARPLLCLGAAEVRAYCRAAGLAFGDDRTNATPAYARNVLRLEVLPRLEALNPRVSETLAAASLQAAAEAEVLRAAVRDARARVQPAAGPQGTAAVDVGALAAEPPALRALVLHDVVREAMGGEALVEHRLVEALLALAARPGGGTVAVGRGLEAAREGGLLLVRAAVPPHHCAPVTVAGDVLVAGDARAGTGAGPAAGPAREADHGRAASSASFTVAFCGRRVSLCLRQNASFEPGAALAGGACVGLRAAPARVTLRHARRGERFAPSGLGGETTVARFLAAQRVPQGQRARALVLDVDGVCAWLGYPGPGGRHGGRVAQSFLVDESTICTLTVELEEA